MSIDLDVVVLGGGIGGLTSAHRLAARGLKTAVLERTRVWGGLARSIALDGIEVEAFYHHYFTHDLHVLNLIRELGLGGSLVFRQVRQAVLIEGSLYPFTTPFDLLRLRPLPFFQRLRLGLLVAGRSADDLEGISVEEWIVEHVGRETYDRLFGPLVRAKFGSPGSQIAAAFARGRLRARAKSRTRSRWTEKLGYLDGGSEALTGRLVAETAARGAILVSDCELVDVKRVDGGFRLTYRRDGELATVRSRSVISTIPTGALARVLAGEPDSVRDGLSGIPFRAAAVACLSLSKALSPYYWTSVADTAAPFNAVVEHTRLHGEDRYRGRHILYLGRYLDPSDPDWGLSDTDLLAKMTDSLPAVFPGFSKGAVTASTLTPDRHASPIFGVGYARTVGALLDAVPGLFIGGTVRVYPGSRNVNSAVGIGIDLAARVAEACA